MQYLFELNCVLRCYFWYGASNLGSRDNVLRHCPLSVNNSHEGRSVATCMACVYYVTAYLAPDGLGNTSHTRAWWVELLLHASLPRTQRRAGWQQVIFVAPCLSLAYATWAGWKIFCVCDIPLNCSIIAVCIGMIQWKIILKDIRTDSCWFFRAPYLIVRIWRF